MALCETAADSIRAICRDRSTRDCWRGCSLRWPWSAPIIQMALERSDTQHPKADTTSEAVHRGS